MRFTGKGQLPIEGTAPAAREPIFRCTLWDDLPVRPVVATRGPCSGFRQRLERRGMPSETPTPSARPFIAPSASRCVVAQRQQRVEDVVLVVRRDAAAIQAGCGLSRQAGSAELVPEFEQQALGGLLPMPGIFTQAAGFPW